MNNKLLEENLCLEEFVVDALFPGGMPGGIKEGFRILEAAGRDDLFKLLQKEFPAAVVEQRKQGQPVAEGVFDYITAAGIKYLACTEETHRLFRELTAGLKPGGIISTRVCGFSGYYGLVMLGAVIRRLSRGKNPAETLKIAEAVTREIPTTHPAFDSGQLNPREKTTLKELLEISAAVPHLDNLFTVSKLLDTIPRWGGRFTRWAFPRQYDPGSTFESGDPIISRRLNTLPEPGRSAVTELITAFPPEHYFLMRKA